MLCLRSYHLKNCVVTCRFWIQIVLCDPCAMDADQVVSLVSYECTLCCVTCQLWIKLMLCYWSVEVNSYRLHFPPDSIGYTFHCATVFVTWFVVTTYCIVSVDAYLAASLVILGYNLCCATVCHESVRAVPVATVCVVLLDTDPGP